MLSIAIPTHNRADSLQKCLDHIAHQTAFDIISEICVADDASSYNVLDLIGGHCLSKKIKYTRHSENRGAGATRNSAIKLTTFPTVMILDDDVMLEGPCIREFLRDGFPCRRNDSSRLGYVSWDKQVTVTPFMYWMENGGPQFAYHRINNQADCGWQYFNGSLMGVLGSNPRDFQNLLTSIC